MMTLASVRDEYRTAVLMAPYYARSRPALLRALGTELHPAAITEAWYAADCPPRLDAKAAGLLLGTRIRWHVAMALRGARRAER